MIKRTSNKLFWDKYAYKLGVYNSATHIFRNKRLENARDIIDGLELKSGQGQPLRLKFHRYSQRETDITENDFFDLKVLIFLCLSSEEKLANVVLGAPEKPTHWFLYPILTFKH